MPFDLPALPFWAHRRQRFLLPAIRTVTPMDTSMIKRQSDDARHKRRFRLPLHLLLMWSTKSRMTSSTR